MSEQRFKGIESKPKFFLFVWFFGLLGMITILLISSGLSVGLDDAVVVLMLSVFGAAVATAARHMKYDM